jgi:hypothetical protein
MSSKKREGSPMSEEAFLDKHWTSFVKFISSLSPQGLEQQRRDYLLLVAEDPEHFRSRLRLIDKMCRRGKAA